MLLILSEIDPLVCSLQDMRKDTIEHTNKHNSIVTL